MKVEFSKINFEQNKSDNLSLNERRALRDLMNNNEIINKADKGSTLVILDKGDC